MKKTFEVITLLAILGFMGVALWQITNVGDSNQPLQVESSKNFEVYEDDILPIIPEPTPGTDEPIVCTMDAKICPDGSYVGRTGPNCEFEECPVQVLDMSQSLIRYGEDVSLMEEYREDCENQDGVFNECDSACGPGTMECVSVCSMTCSIDDFEEESYRVEELAPFEEVIECTPESKMVEICTMEYAPVCGQMEIETQTFSNACGACSTGGVISYTEEECLTVR